MTCSICKGTGKRTTGADQEGRRYKVDCFCTRHEWNEDGCCIHCGYDGAEADYYSRRGYAHEYPDLKGPCLKRQQREYRH